MIVTMDSTKKKALNHCLPFIISEMTYVMSVVDELSAMLTDNEYEDISVSFISFSPNLRVYKIRVI